MVKYFTKLNHTIIKGYVDRKHSGMIALFYNTKNRKFIPVPKNMEHAELVASILGVDLEDIRNKFVNASYFIPMVLIMVDKEYQGLIVGSSSLEMGCGVRHKKADLINARNATLVLLERSPFKLKKDFQEFVSMKYSY